MTLRSSLALLALVALATPVRGVDDTISGESLALRQGRQKAQLVLVARTPIVAPLPGTSEDPTLHGAIVDIGNPQTGEWARLTAPAGDWSVNALGTVFRFRAPARGSGIRSLVIRHGRRIQLRASAVGITLDEPTQGGLAVSLATGTRRYCMVFGGTVRRDEPGKFAARKAPAPSICPVPGATLSTTTTTSSTLDTDAPRSTSTTRRATSTTSSSSTSSTKPPKPPKPPKDPKDPMGGHGGDDDSGPGGGDDD